MAKHELSTTANYADTWGWWEGARDIGQNHVDALKMLGAELDVSYRPETKTLLMVTRGTTIDTRALLLGHTTKKGDDRAAGQYGEGMKLAFLAFLRIGYEITIRTGDELWSPKIERSERYKGAQVLVVHTRKLTFKNEVVSKIVGIEPEEFELFKLRMLDIAPPNPEEVVDVEGGRLLLEEKYRGKLFVKGIYVQDVQNMKFGYDLYDLKVDRDRRMASGWEIESEATRTLARAVRKRKDLAKDLYRNAESGRTVDGSGFGIRYEGDEVIDSLLECFRAEHGEDAIPVDSEYNAQRVRNLGGRAAIIAARSLRETLETKTGSLETTLHRLAYQPVETFPREALTDAELDSLRGAEKVLKAIGIEVHADVVRFRDSKRLGTADLGTGHIRLSIECLKQGRKGTLKTLVHEYAHVVSKAGDSDSRHTAAIEDIWSDIWLNQRCAMRELARNAKESPNRTPLA